MSWCQEGTSLEMLDVYVKLVWDALPRSGYGKVPKNEVKRLLNEREQA